MYPFRFILILIFVGSLIGPSTRISFAGDDIAAKHNDFFESRIRPLLVNHCLECHGPTKSEGELRLDSRAAIMQGGASGEPGAVAKQPAASQIVQAVRHTGDYEMPPNGKLSDEEIADLERWVEIGSPWPESTPEITPTSMAERIQQHQQKHWAFQPLRRPTTPVSENGETIRLDSFIQSKLREHQLAASPRADRRTLIRRATFDLTGLPPTPRQVELFINDEAPDAYAKLIDRLLDSPQYGERWARHWLDVARYADTSGYTFDNADRRYPFAFTYRDYVIDAFNNDLPYDQFIREQLAADYLDVPNDNRTLAALGFLTVGRKYINPNDTYDDQVDVVTRGLMGLTVSCARCHDHKYDAIPTQDYYSLFAVFANNYVPSDLPLLGNPKANPEFKSFFESLNKLESDVENFSVDRHRVIRQHVRDYFSDYIARIIEPDQADIKKKYPFIKLEPVEVRPEVLARWTQYLANQSVKNPKVLKPILELVGIPAEKFSDVAPQLITHWSENPVEFQFNRLLIQKLKKRDPKQKIELAQIMGELFDETFAAWKKKGAGEPIVAQFKGPRRELARLFFGQSSPASLRREDVDAYLNHAERKQIRKLRNAVTVHNSESPSGINRAMVLRDDHPIVEQKVMVRGTAPVGDVAPRRFIALLSDSKTRPEFQERSGRLELANHIASPDNPLTARVLVNRVWMHHFSDPLVDTPSDFGIRCPEPMHRDLLDYLAADFMDNGWSIKHLHRKIMLSDTYQQSSANRAIGEKLDPENRLYWKMNRRRLEFEALRDSILMVSGNLDKQLYGKSVDLLERPHPNRRTIYGFIDRQDLPNLFRAFDLANPDQSSSKRIRTCVPQQSLYMMNSHFVIEQAHQLADSLENQEQDLETRIKTLYQRLFQRDPSPTEFSIGSAYLKTASPVDHEKHIDPWVRYAQLLMFTNEFEFVD